MSTFVALGLNASVLRAVAELKFGEPTEVQQQAIPPILGGRDVWASAPTGSGKTAAFVLPLLQLLGEKPRQSPRPVRGLVLVPTRELAAQVAEVVQRCSRTLPVSLKCCLAVGGVSVNPQQMALLGGADLVVATPGRLLELVANNALQLSAVQTLVLDEADRLFSLGFADELSRVLALLPSRRQNLLFSATFPKAVQDFAAGLLHEPARVTVAAEPPASSAITHRAIEVDEGQRTALLRHLLQTEGWSRVLVFVASRQAAERVAIKLQRAGVGAAPLHGELSQGARSLALADFKSLRVRVLVATDVAARGLDVVQLPAVVNYELPRSTTDYLHRVGRTGRAGERGVAVSFVTAAQAAHFQLIERRHHLRLTRERVPGFEPTTAAVAPAVAAGGLKGKRKSKKDKLREAKARAELKGS